MGRSSFQYKRTKRLWLSMLCGNIINSHAILNLSKGFITLWSKKLPNLWFLSGMKRLVFLGRVTIFGKEFMELVLSQHVLSMRHLPPPRTLPSFLAKKGVRKDIESRQRK